MSDARVHADVAVVGLGAVGIAVACQLAMRGVRVLGIDRFHPPHDRGSSHGRTRITRLAVGEGAGYVPLVQQSHRLWRRFEGETGLALMRQTGVLVLASASADEGMFHGQSGFFQRTVELARRFGITHEMLDARQVGERFPAFVPREDDTAYFEPDGGVLFPENCIRAQWQLAVQHGAELRAGEAVLDMSSAPGSLTLRTERATVHAGQVVWCTGAWLPAHVGGALQTRLRVLRQVLHWFEADTPTAFDPARCPAYIWLHGAAAEESFYGFPMVDGLPGVKVATEQMRETADPDAVRRDVDAADTSAMFERHLRGRLQGLRPKSVHDAVCLYTMAPDGNFIVDRHPRHDGVTLVSACSGHGFKHSAALGEAIASRLLGEPVPLLDSFAAR